MATPRIGMVAGEASGDLLAASVLACWRSRLMSSMMWACAGGSNWVWTSDGRANR